MLEILTKNRICKKKVENPENTVICKQNRTFKEFWGQSEIRENFENQEKHGKSRKHFNTQSILTFELFRGDRKFRKNDKKLERR